MATLEWNWVDIQYDVDVDTLHTMLFTDGANLAVRLRVEQGHTELDLSAWEDGKRTVTYTMPKKAGLYKACAAIEQQRYTEYRPGELYVVDGLQKAPGLPYGKSFQTKIRTTLCAMPGADRCRMIQSIEMEFTKSTMMKSMIINSAKGATKVVLSGPGAAGQQHLVEPCN